MWISTDTRGLAQRLVGITLHIPYTWAKQIFGATSFSLNEMDPRGRVNEKSGHAVARESVRCVPLHGHLFLFVGGKKNGGLEKDGCVCAWIRP